MGYTPPPPQDFADLDVEEYRQWDPGPNPLLMEPCQFPEPEGILPGLLTILFIFAAGMMAGVVIGRLM